MTSPFKSNFAAPGPLLGRGARRQYGALHPLTDAATPAAIDVPSGQPVALHEVRVDQMGAETWVRFRFVAPLIARAGGTVDYDVASLDMAALCRTLAVPYLAQHDLHGDVIVISLADRPTEFGAADRDATQFFEAFRLQGDVCIWEGF